MPDNSLKRRAVLAVLLMFGFYALAFLLAGSLFFFVYAEVMWANEIFIRPTILCIIAGFAILWSVMPRRDKFEAPGPQLTESEHPELFAVLRDVATKTSQAMPADVYLVGDVNAWVMQRGGFGGVGSRRVMGLGLPLLQSVTISQFRAIVAHEFGHYHGGDTQLGPLIYRTREAIGRTIENLSAHGILHKPFLWYGKFYLRVTQAISRAQELAADRLAASITGPRAAAGALVAVHGAAVAYGTYWSQEVVPLLGSGYRPPIATGFSRFVTHFADAVRDAVDHELREGKVDEFDSHPPLRERVDALKALPQETGEADDPREASTLLRDLSRAELELLRSLAPDRAPSLEQLAWEEAAMKVYLPQWRSRSAEHAAALQGVTPSTLPQVVRELPAFVAKLTLREVPYGKRNEEAALILGCALAARLHDHGWACDTGPGRSVVFQKGEQSIEPFSIIPQLTKGDLTDVVWADRCRAGGIESLSLGAA
jgi:Zn-dependent protease with chaperone function